MLGIFHKVKLNIVVTRGRGTLEFKDMEDLLDTRHVKV